MRPPTNPSPIDFLAWVADLVDDHQGQGKAPRVSQPGRVVDRTPTTHETRLEQWLFDLSDQDRVPPRKK